VVAGVGKELWSETRARNRLTHREEHGENKSPLQLAGKAREANFMSSCNQWGLSSGVLKVRGLAQREPRDIGAALGEKAGKQSMNIQCRNSDLKSTWGSRWGGYLLISEHVPERKNSQRNPSWNKGNGRCRFPPPTPHDKHRATCRN